MNNNEKTYILSEKNIDLDNQLDNVYLIRYNIKKIIEDSILVFDDDIAAILNENFETLLSTLQSVETKIRRKISVIESEIDRDGNIVSSKIIEKQPKK